MLENLKRAPIQYSELGARAEPPVIADLMHRALANPELLSLAAGFTDNAALPSELIKGAVLALESRYPDSEHLQYTSNQGRAILLEQVAQWLNSYEAETYSFQPDQVFMSNGSQQALYLAMQTLCNVGDIVLVEEPSYFVFLELLKGLGIEAVAMPAFEGDALQEFLTELKTTEKWARIKAVYIEGYFANPSSKSLSLPEKENLAAAMQVMELMVPVLEDAAYRELYFEKPYPAPSILSIPAFDDFPKLYLGTFTKPFATGLKIGYAYCSEPDWRARMLAAKGHQDFGSANFSQAIIEHVLMEGAYGKHLEAIRAHYAKKAKMMGDILESSQLREKGWSWKRPEGGLYYWMQGPEGIDTSMNSALCRKCIETGVLYVPGDLCMVDTECKHYIRLSFGALAESKLADATERFVRACLTF